MNKKNYILALIAMFVLAIGFSSCEEEEEYKSDWNKGTPPTVTINVVADGITDTGADITLSTNQDGNIFWIVVPAGQESADMEAYEVVLDPDNSIEVSA